MSDLTMFYNAECITEINESPSADDWEIIARELFKLLDDIDTYSDVYKPEQTRYYVAVSQKHQQRFKYMTSDGYEIYPMLQD